MRTEISLSLLPPKSTISPFFSTFYRKDLQFFLKNLFLTKNKDYTNLPE
jgi:hypothetical protein